MKTNDDNQLKKEMGKRFKQFRESTGKTQQQLAKELKVHERIFANIETGVQFPGVEYLFYFSSTYRLNCNWLLSGEGECSMTGSVSTSTLKCHIPSNDPRRVRYEELIHLMKVHAIEQIILGKLEMVKLIAKDEIKEFKKNEGK